MKNMQFFGKSLILTPCLNFFKNECRLLIHFRKYPNPRNLLELSPRKGSTKRYYHININVQTYSQPSATTQPKEWHYIYFTYKNVGKVPHIISYFKNYTMSTKNHLTNYVIAIKRCARFVEYVCVRSFIY